jgi:hypothetical protein
MPHTDYSSDCRDWDAADRTPRATTLESEAKENATHRPGPEEWNWLAISAPSKDCLALRSDSASHQLAGSLGSRFVQGHALPQRTLRADDGVPEGAARRHLERVAGSRAPVAKATETFSSITTPRTGISGSTCCTRPVTICCVSRCNRTRFCVRSASLAGPGMMMRAIRIPPP